MQHGVELFGDQGVDHGDVAVERRTQRILGHAQPHRGGRAEPVICDLVAVGTEERRQPILQRDIPRADELSGQDAITERGIVLLWLVSRV